MPDREAASTCFVAGIVVVRNISHLQQITQGAEMLNLPLEEFQQDLEETIADTKIIADSDCVPPKNLEKFKRKLEEISTMLKKQQWDSLPDAIGQLEETLKPPD